MEDIVVDFKERRQVRITPKDSAMSIMNFFVTRVVKNSYYTNFYDDTNKTCAYVGFMYSADVILEDTTTPLGDDSRYSPVFPPEPADGAGESLKTTPEVKQADPDNARCL